MLSFTLMDISLMNWLSLFLSALKSVPIANEEQYIGLENFYVHVPALLNKMY